MATPAYASIGEMMIGVISTSSRQGSYSLKVADNLASRLVAAGVEAFVVDLHKLDLPLFGSLAVSQAATDGLDKIKPKLQAADGFVVVTPEWNGTAAPGWSNLMLFIDDALAHKPVMPVGVSAGRGGAYPLVALRAASYKNSRYVVIPESLIVSHCQEAFNDDGSLADSPAAESLGPRADYALKVLVAYAQALKTVRSDSLIDHQQYPSGV